MCTVCAFDIQKTILILKQPQSVVAKVSDNQIASSDDPLDPTNNLRTFTVAAKGTSALTYQWYYRYGATDWKVLKDGTEYVAGSKTNTLTISIPVDACHEDYSYKCVIKDTKGNQVTTNTAYLKAQHVYGKYVSNKGALIGTIMQSGTGNNIGRYATEGHYKLCVGDGCEAEKLEAHSYSKQTRLIYDSKTGERWLEQICIHCGFKNYILDHIHYFYDPVTFEYQVDTTYKNGNQHRLKCLWLGCDKTTLEAHDKMGWQNHGTPYSNADKIGVPYQECQICGLSTEKQLQTYNAAKDKNENAQWTQSNDLVFVENGYASCDLVVNGSKLIIGFEPSEYAKKELLGMKNPTVTGWKVRYLCDRTPSGSVIDVDVTKDFTFTKVENELKWLITVPLFSQRKGGGVLIFTPVVEECKHNSGTRIKNASEPICTKDGYTGDTVCADCEGVIFYGDVIESSHKHEGKLTLIPGTSKEGTCEQRGYEGTYRCDHCNQKVRGKSTAKVHNSKTVTKNAVAVTCTKFGYSGDIYCECGVLLKEGEVLAPRHTDLRLINENKASCMKKGYTGDWKCFTCNQIVKYGYNVAKGDHAWSKWGSVNDQYHRHTCVVSGCGAEEKAKHTDANRDLVCDSCGYVWKSNDGKIRHITFNIDIPEIGAKPDYTAFNGPCFDSDGTGTYKKNGVQWFDVTANKRFVPSGVGQEFKEGHVYKVTIDFRTKADYEFGDEGEMTATINGREAVIEYATYNQFVGISYTFEALKHIHDMERINKVAATCTTAGKQTYYHCKSCNKYYENQTATKEITDVTKWGVGSALGHVESAINSNSTHHFKVCTRCYKEKEGSKKAHSGGTATCMEKAKCTECGETYGKVAEHKLATDTWMFINTQCHARKCLTENCGHTGEFVPHRSSGPATDDKDEVCLDCGFVITKSKNHKHTPMGDIQHDDDNHWTICGCGEIIEKTSHIDANGDGKCDVCSSETVNPGTNDENPDAPGKTDGGTRKSKNLLWLWISLGVIAAAGGGFALYWFVFRKKKRSV